MSRTAEEYNEEFEAYRQEAREGDDNVVKFNLSEDDLGKQIRSLTAEAHDLIAERKAINEQMKAIYERVDSLRLDRQEFKAAMKLLDVDDIHRDKKQRTRRAFLRAHGLPEQVDMFYDPQAAERDDPLNQDDLDLDVDGTESTDDQDDTMAAIRQAWAEEDEENDDDDLDGDDDDILSRAGVATVSGDD